MKSVSEKEATSRLDAIRDEAQREPIVIPRQGRDIAVILSCDKYERLRAANVQAFLDLTEPGCGRSCGKQV
jgi:PHD/YefM family antitoxin component YafN of YafNO toxin-antitoxin module